MKANLKQFGFAHQTPSRVSNVPQGDFSTTQKDKYNITNRQLERMFINSTHHPVAPSETRNIRLFYALNHKL